MKEISISPEVIHGAISIEETVEGLTPYRLPYFQRSMFDENLFDRAECCAGVRLRFSSDTKTLSLVVLPEKEPRRFDLVSEEGDLLSSVELSPNASQLVFSGFQSSGLLEIWLPQRATVTLVKLLIDDDASIQPVADSRKKWLIYGSSISHCGEAHSPARTWPATVARKLDLNLTCMGYSGQCHMDGMVAKVIRDQEVDLITLKLGINIYGGSSLGPRSYKNALINFVTTLREKHPKTPISVITPILSPPREDVKNLVDFTLKEIRAENEAAVQIFKSCGDENIEIFSGLELFNEGDVSMLPDDLHPNGDGYELMGQRFCELLYPKIQEKMEACAHV